MNADLSGAMTCARYAFAPNYYHYCGPDTQGEFGEYLREETADGGLIEHLTNFEVMYPYLAAIATANGVKDPLDPRVVEAYWVGSKMLEKVTEQDVYVALVEKQNLKKRISKDEMRWLLPKIDKQARLHHSFHVLNVFTRTGHHTVKHTVETMDQCRISWGGVLKKNMREDSTTPNPSLQRRGNLPLDKGELEGVVRLDSQQLIFKDGKLKLVPIEREVMMPAEEFGGRLKPGDWVSVHWGFVCDKLSSRQVKVLEKYTKHHIKLANATL